MFLFISKLKKILGVLTDILLIGRARDWWKRRRKFPRG